MNGRKTYDDFTKSSALYNSIIKLDPSMVFTLPHPVIQKDIKNLDGWVHYIFNVIFLEDYRLIRAFPCHRFGVHEAVRPRVLC